MARSRPSTWLAHRENVAHDDLAAPEGGEYGTVGAMLQRKVAGGG